MAAAPWCRRSSRAHDRPLAVSGLPIRSILAEPELYLPVPDPRVEHRLRLRRGPVHDVAVGKVEDRVVPGALHARVVELALVQRAARGCARRADGVDVVSL